MAGRRTRWRARRRSERRRVGEVDVAGHAVQAHAIAVGGIERGRGPAHGDVDLTRAVDRGDEKAVGLRPAGPALDDRPRQRRHRQVAGSGGEVLDLDRLAFARADRRGGAEVDRVEAVLGLRENAGGDACDGGVGGHRHRAGHAMAEIFAAELRADAERLRHLLDFLLHLLVAKRVAVLGTVVGQRVVIFAGSELDRFHGQLGQGAADDDGEIVPGHAAVPSVSASSGRQHWLADLHRAASPGTKRLVGRAAALGDEQKLVRRIGLDMIRIAALGIKLDLRRHLV